MSTPAPCRPMPARTGIPVDEDELRRWLDRLCDRGYRESTAKLWISRIRTAYAHGIRDAAAVDVAFINLTGDSRSGLRQALRELDYFRRSA